MKLVSIVVLSTVLFTLSSCDPNHHRPTDHPCNFPDAETENDFRGPYTYAIIDKVTSVNLVDTTQNATIHLDSIIMMDEELSVIPHSSFYFGENWILDNLDAYKDVPFNDPAVLLDLTELTFYLQTSSGDLDTVNVFFQQCLILSVTFNGLTTEQPQNGPSQRAWASFYFRK